MRYVLPLGWQWSRIGTVYQRRANRVPVSMRIIAVMAFGKSILFLAAGLIVGRIIDHQGATLLSQMAHMLRVTEETTVYQRAMALLNGNTSTFQVIDAVCFAYAALYLIQALGLWFDRSWAEWLTLVMACLLIPYEIYELHHPSTIKAGMLLINLVVVGFLVHRLQQKRFGKKIV